MRERERKRGGEKREGGRERERGETVIKDLCLFVCCLLVLDCYWRSFERLRKAIYW